MYMRLYRARTRISRTITFQSFRPQNVFEKNTEIQTKTKLYLSPYRSVRKYLSSLTCIKRVGVAYLARREIRPSIRDHIGSLESLSSTKPRVALHQRNFHRKVCKYGHLSIPILNCRGRTFRSYFNFSKTANFPRTARNGHPSAFQLPK